jgi:hypothetical protein
MTKQQLLERLQDYPENSPLWNAIADLIVELQELNGLQWLYSPNAMEAYGNSVHAERLHELERRFSI